MNLPAPKTKRRFGTSNPAGILLLVIIQFSIPHSVSSAGGGEWVYQPSMPTRRLGLAACEVDGKIFVVGGYASANAPGLSTLEVYDPKTETWSSKADMPTARLWLSASAVNGKIYVFGGFQQFGSPPLKTVESYDVAGDTWETLAEMPTARKALSTVVVDGKVYAIGGATATDQTLGTVEVYDPGMDSWTAKADMPTPRAMLATSAMNGKIYAFGGPLPGRPGISTVEEYDPETDTWTEKADMPTARWAPVAVPFNDKIYVIGGGGGTSGLPTVEEYIPSRDLWITRSQMTYQVPNGTGRILEFKSWGLAGAAAEDRIYVLGGASRGPPHPGTDLLLKFTPPDILAANTPLGGRLMVKDSDPFVRLEWPTLLGYHYTIQYAETLDVLEWTPLKQLQGSSEILVEELAVDGNTGFYRLLVSSNYLDL